MCFRVELECSDCAQVTDIPLQDLPLEVKHVLENFAAHLDVPVVSQFIMNILAAILETVPEANSKQSVPKAKVLLAINQYSASDARVVKKATGACISVTPLCCAGWPAYHAITPLENNTGRFAASQQRSAPWREEVQWTKPPTSPVVAHQSDSQVGVA